MAKKWNPQPMEFNEVKDKNGKIVTSVSQGILDGRKAYYAGYSDGFHGYHKGSGHEKPWLSEYLRGFDEGSSSNG